MCLTVIIMQGISLGFVISPVRAYSDVLAVLVSLWAHFSLLLAGRAEFVPAATE